MPKAIIGGLRMQKFRYIQLIKDFRQEMGLTVNQFCKIAKIGVGTYYKIINNKYNFDEMLIEI